MVKILVVEDDILIQNLMVLKLKKESYDVIVANDGVEGVHLAQTEAPDLILMDMRLPFLDGWEATEQLKTSPHTSAIPIIALTAQTYSAVQEKWENMRCDGYAAKPIHFPTLLAQITTLTQSTKDIVA